MIPDDLWERIRPENKSAGGGLLCGPCILERIEGLRMKDYRAFQLKEII
jgi:hypothetical protein